MSQQPPEGARVLASIADGCPDLVVWQRRGEVWIDEHGCRHRWSDLTDVVVLPSEQEA